MHGIINLLFSPDGILRIQRRILSLPAMAQLNNPLHGKSLELILTELVEKLGWEQMGKRINIKCFNENPSISSSLKFLRKTEWARAKVEELYLKVVRSG